MVRFDPIVDLASGLVVGEEAVPARWLPVLDEACRHARVRSARAGSPLSVWVDLLWPDAERVSVALRQTDLPPEQLVVQVAETSLYRRGSYDGLVALKDLGVQLAVRRSEQSDPRLRALRGLPIDILRFRASEPASLLIDRGHELGLVMHADEVDDEATAASLLALDCDLAQGAVFAGARPMGRNTPVAAIS
jgi:EAL domain-containing protein (putative c-di-GMP-specific phosphodiesterase class I)